MAVTVSYSTAVLYSRDHGGLEFSVQKYHPFYLLLSTVQKYWLGIAKLKNVFRLTLNPSIKLFCNFIIKLNSVLTN